MKTIKLIGTLTLGLFMGAAPSAWADNVAHCEALIMQSVTDETGNGEAQIVSYRPAVPFLASLYDEEDGHLSQIDGFPIRAILCRRNNVIPAETDYPILETGLPFILSQDFDSPDTDSLTTFWKEDALDYVYKGHPLTEEAQANLETRLADFTQRGKIEMPSAELDPEAEPDAKAVTETADEAAEVETSDEADMPDETDNGEEPDTIAQIEALDQSDVISDIPVISDVPVVAEMPVVADIPLPPVDLEELENPVTQDVFDSPAAPEDFEISETSKSLENPEIFETTETLENTETPDNLEIEE